MQLEITANCEADEPCVQRVVWHLGHALMWERRNGQNTYSTCRSGQPWTTHPGPHGLVPVQFTKLVFAIQRNPCVDHSKRFNTIYNLLTHYAQQN